MIKKETNAMKKEQMEQDTRAKCAYAPPHVEIYAAEPGALLAGTTTIGGGAGGGIDDNIAGGGAGQAGEDPGIGDAPPDGSTNFGGGAAKILGREFSFSDVWED